MIYVFGCNGMLGRYVHTYLDGSTGVDRTAIDAANTDLAPLRELVLDGMTCHDVVINCMGVIKPMIEVHGDNHAIMVNSIFPRMLADFCSVNQVPMIHVTTDCIFSGRSGPYAESNHCDVQDMYGLSKYWGEPQNACVIRTSIIGEEVDQGRSLLEWFKTRADKTANGFVNHYWNGITCLQFAKTVKHLIDNKHMWSGIKHVYSNDVTKLELLRLLNKTYELNVDVESVKTDMVDRRLRTLFPNTLVGCRVVPLEQQLEELKEYGPKLRTVGKKLA